MPLRTHWIATPSVPAAQVSEVDFLIDQKLGWVEHKAPYVYGDDGNWLVTSFLTPGSHTFTTKVLTTDGQAASDVVTAAVAASPHPPSALDGSWKRTVTAADLSAVGPNGPPPGLWRYTFAQIGLIGHDPQDGGGVSDIAYLSTSTVQLRPTIEHPPYPSPNNGGFCDDTDPLVTYTYSLGAGGTSMTLRPEGKSDPCPARGALLTGTWTRTARDPLADHLASS